MVLELGSGWVGVAICQRTLLSLAHIFAEFIRVRRSANIQKLHASTLYNSPVTRDVPGNLAASSFKGTFLYSD